ncbi:MAG: hypothetical protein C0596_11225 [Marinilabiliales bacterium]|nr:MAG: hypothetical protein C0596_11225 [Marinilabiliales bacterium]
MTKAQDFNYISIGYRSSIIPMSNFNDLIDTYNNTRSFLDNEMEHIWYMHGPAVGWGINFYDYTIGISWEGKRQVVSSGGTPPGGVYTTRDLKLRYNQLSFDFMVAIDYYHAVGISYDLGIMRSLTRTSLDETEDFTSIEGNRLNSVTLFGHISLNVTSIGGILLKPYVQFPFKEFRFRKTVNTLDEANSLNYSTADYEVKPFNFGVTIAWRFYIDN